MLFAGRLANGEAAYSLEHCTLPPFLGDPSGGNRASTDRLRLHPSQRPRHEQQESRISWIAALLCTWNPAGSDVGATAVPASYLLHGKRVESSPESAGGRTEPCSSPSRRCATPRLRKCSRYSCSVCGERPVVVVARARSADRAVNWATSRLAWPAPAPPPPGEVRPACAGLSGFARGGGSRSSAPCRSLRRPCTTGGNSPSDSARFVTCPTAVREYSQSVLGTPAVTGPRGGSRSANRKAAEATSGCSSAARRLGVTRAVYCVLCVWLSGGGPAGATPPGSAA